MLRKVEIQDGWVNLTLALTSLDHPLSHRVVSEARRAVLALDGVRQVDVTLEEMSPAEKQSVEAEHGREGQGAARNEVRYVIAVISGKGGVGKSLVSSLLAVALRRAGHRVGVLDADITGPSIPRMFFAQAAPLRAARSGGILPAQTRSGIGVMSINLMLERSDQAIIWRGPLIGRAIQQFWADVAWGALDYLVVDLPPGTSDASLTVMQSLPLSGVLLVTSPQDLASMVVRKAAQMAQVMGIPMLGLVENMSYFVCPDTGKHHKIFGPSHAAEIAHDLGIPLLGRLPLDPAIAGLCDQGRIEEYSMDAFRAIADQVVAMAGEARPPRLSTGSPRTEASHDAATRAAKSASEAAQHQA
jgi:Mrp family chromosome partitioning ATPase